MKRTAKPEGMSFELWMKGKNNVLVRAVQQLDIEGIEKALLEEANPNHKCPRGHGEGFRNEPILITAIAGHYDIRPTFSEMNRPEIVRLLLRAGANPNACSQSGIPALGLAYSKYPIARLLLEYGADPNMIITTDGSTTADYIHDLLQEDVDRDIRNTEGWRVLHLCGKFGADMRKYFLI